MLFLHKTFPFVLVANVSPKAPTAKIVEPNTDGSLAKSPNEEDAEPMSEFSKLTSHNWIPFTALRAVKEPPLKGKSTLFPEAAGETVANTLVFFWGPIFVHLNFFKFVWI